MMIVFRSVPRCFPLLGFSAAVISFPLGADQKPLRWWSGGLSLFWWFQTNNCHDIDDDHKRCSNWQKDTEKIIFMNILIMILVFPWNKHICFSIVLVIYQNVPKVISQLLKKECVCFKNCSSSTLLPQLQ